MSRGPANQHERATEKPVHIPTVLAVGCSDAMLARCWDALVGLGVMVRDCEPALAATLVASRKPLAIVMPSHVHALDPEEFDALARDVRATIVKIDDDATTEEISAVVGVALRAALRRREARRPASGAFHSNPPSGRYSILPGELSASSFAPASTSAPPTSDVGPSLVLDALEEELLAVLR
jgi:hypothetical protein